MASLHKGIRVRLRFSQTCLESGRAQTAAENESLPIEELGIEKLSTNPVTHSRRDLNNSYFSLSLFACRIIPHFPFNHSMDIRWLQIGVKKVHAQT